MASRSTPRKTRHARNPSHHQRVVSDYDSDYLTPSGGGNGSSVHNRPPPTRTNSELNFSVVSRYLGPRTRQVLGIAANAVVYLFQTGTGPGTTPATSATPGAANGDGNADDAGGERWDKTDVEGTLFVVELAPAPEEEAALVAAVEAGDYGGARDELLATRPVAMGGGGQAAEVVLFVLNRHSLDNFAINLSAIRVAEMTDSLMIFKTEPGVSLGRAVEGPDAGGGDAKEKVFGLWLHAEGADTRETNGQLIMDRWYAVRQRRERVLAIIAQRQQRVDDEIQRLETLQQQMQAQSHQFPHHQQVPHSGPDHGHQGYQVQQADYLQQAQSQAYDQPQWGYEEHYAAALQHMGQHQQYAHQQQMTQGQYYQQQVGAEPGRQVSINELFGLPGGGPH